MKNPVQGEGDNRIYMATRYLERAKIAQANREYIRGFVNQLSAEGLTKVRQAKYIYALVGLAARFNKAFDTITKEDVIKVIGDINSGDYSEWTNSDLDPQFLKSFPFIL